MESKEIIRYWSEASVFDETTRNEIKQLLNLQDEKELADRFSQALEFGTGGMRGIMGAGINRMNRYTVRQATEGLARYIEKNPDPAHSGVVIGYDSRHNSPQFAQAASEVLAAHGIPVFLFKSLAPTPLISYEVLQKKAIAGIMITASHNPSEYNGYKVYWKNGGQVIPPEDKGIIQEVRDVKTMEEIPDCNFEEAIRQGTIQWLTEESDHSYLETVGKMALGNSSQNEKLHVIYTPLHGTGVRLVPALLEQRGFLHLKQIGEQSKPDSDFSTVRSPNPEDSRAFEMAIAAAAPEDELILANDPDADRLGVMVRHQEEWQYLNGNQAGALLLDYYLKNLKDLNRLPHNGTYILSIVSSPLGAKIARSHGLQVIETLTGFKWIRAEALRIEQEGSGAFVFGMEESLGYLAGHHTGDKDGVWAAMAFAEMTADLKAKGETPIDRLQQIYQNHGFHLDDLENRILPGIDGNRQIEEIMNNFRQNPPLTIGGKQLLQVTDLLNDTITRIDSSAVMPGPGLPPSNVLIFELEKNTRIIVRPSGTEPKIKYYFNLSGPDQSQLKQILSRIKKDLLT
ncbi:MAG: phospho-sugar mutase [SAR324 cluster bacterium]|nr:phospho-sugar mutase [SAR324 cluster bacterium]